MPNNDTIDQTVRIDVDTSGVDEALDQSERSMSRFQRLVSSVGQEATKFFRYLVTGSRTAADAIDDSTDAIDEAEEHARNMFAGFSMRQMQSEIDRTSRRFDDLLDRQNYMKFMGVDRASSSFRSLSYYLENTRDLLTGQLEDAIANVQANMARIAESTVPTDEYTELQNNMERVERQIARLYDKREMMEALGVSEQSQSWRRLEFQIRTANEEYSRFERAARNMEQRGEAYTPGVNTQEYREASDLLAEYRSRLEEARNAQNDYVDRSGSQYSDLFKRILKASGNTAKSFTKNFGNAIKNSFKTAGNVISSLINKFKSLSKESVSLKKSVESMTKKFTSLFTQLALRVKELVTTQLFSDMKENFGQIAKISPEFNTAISSMIDSIKNLGAQIIAIIEPAVNALAPAIVGVIDMFTNAADTVAQFIARLSGSDTYIKASKGQSDYAKSLDKTTASTNKATKANNALKNSVLGFDQLNKLSDNTAEAIGIDTATLEDAETKASLLNTIADNIREAFASGDFFKMGESLSRVVHKAFSWLNKTTGWANNSKKFTDALHNIIDAVNGFATGLNAPKIGRVIGNVVNTIFESLKIITDPKEGIDFGRIGANFGETIISAFNEINWNSVGSAISQTLQGGANFLNGLLTAKITDSVTGEELSLGETIGRSLNKAFSGAINSIDPTTWGGLLANVVNNVTGMITNLFGDASNVIKMAKTIGESINEAISGIDANQLSEAIMSLVTTFTEFFETLFDTIAWGDVWDLLVDTLSSENIDWMKILEAIGIATLPVLIVSTLTTGLGALGGAIASAAATIAASPVVLTAVAGAFGVGSVAYNMTKGIEGIQESYEYVEQQKNEMDIRGYGGYDFSNFSVMGKDLQVWKAKYFGGGGDIGAAAMHAAISGEAVADANNQFVLFGDKLYKAQEYINLFKDQTDGLNSEFIKLGDQTVAVTDQMRDVAQNILDQGTATLTTSDYFTNNLNPALENATSAVNNFTNSLSYDSVAAKYLDPGTYSSYTRSTIPGFANGGIVGDGQLFIANENGAELIGSDGQNTVIVNNEQIISAVTSGVRAAVMEAGFNIAERVSENQSGGGGDIVLQVDSVELARASAKGQRQIDRRGNHTVSFA